MRRPTPLPDPPARPAPSTPAAGGPPGTGTAPASGDAYATAPVIPLAKTPPAGDADTSDGDPTIGPVGLRDVWTASRARRMALRAEVRRFTVRQRRRRRLWIGIAASLVLVAAATLGAAYSPLFAVQTITLAGVEQLDEAQVQDALSSQL